MSSTKFIPIFVCCLAIMSCSLLLASSSVKASSQITSLKQGKKQVATATSDISQSAESSAAPVMTTGKQPIIKNNKRAEVVSVNETLIIRAKRDLMTAAGHKKYHLVKKKPKTKKIKMEVYEPKMKYKKIKMKVPIKVLKKKKVKGYMVKKKHY